MSVPAPGWSGPAAAAVTVLIYASYPVATRAALGGSMRPEDLVFLRFGVGALCFLPYLMLRRREFTPAVLRGGLALSLCQGVAMAALVIFGLQYAPASHAAALGPGVSPAWVALLGYVIFAKRPTTQHVLGALATLAGVIALVGLGGEGWKPQMLLGDAMFLLASAMGALYVLQLRGSGMSAFQGAVLVTVYSALAVVPWYLIVEHASLAGLLRPGVAWDVAWQGFLIGFVALVTMNHAIATLGCAKASALFALVPPVGALIAFAVLGESPSQRELAGILAISLGVTLAVAPAGRLHALRNAVRFAPDAGDQAGSPAARKAAASRAA